MVTGPGSTSEATIDITADNEDEARDAAENWENLPEGAIEDGDTEITVNRIAVVQETAP